jgi:lipopolysaccharide/colanic/teichoic acid biosynthesis glycosyltransferase
MYKQFIKPLFDFIIAVILFILLSPIILTFSLLLFISNRGNVFFFQQRPGLNKKNFNIIKFKTMKGEFGSPLTDEERLTKVGRFVRSASIDEILQLINVLKGEMSLVGPRPLLSKYLSRYNEEQSQRHNVKPGITGWAQVNGRNAISWEQKFKYDVEYVEKLSFGLDLKILFLTFINVLNRKGISADGQATMGEFKGNNVQN